MKYLRILVMALIVIGALNWGLVGFFKYNLLGDLLGGEYSSLARFVFALVGLAGLYSLVFLCKSCCCCWMCGSKSNCSCHKGGHQGQGPEQM
jgi:uncharacterized protein